MLDEYSVKPCISTISILNDDSKLCNNLDEREAIDFCLLTFALDKKDKVKINLFFRGREMAFRDQGQKLLDRFVIDLTKYGQAEKPPLLEGRIMTVLLAPRADKK